MTDPSVLIVPVLDTSPVIAVTAGRRLLGGRLRVTTAKYQTIALSRPTRRLGTSTPTVLHQDPAAPRLRKAVGPVRLSFTALRPHLQPVASLRETRRCSSRR